jgi:peptidoglycan/xylan/chitin deacetylase (PgdA/CDA1 family)
MRGLRGSNSPVIKRVLLKSLEVPGVGQLLARLTGTSTTVFMLHRFTDPENGVHGLDPESVRRILAELRKRRYNLISLEELFRSLKEAKPLERAVVFTIDDGYAEQGRVAGPVFAEFDCPVTTFVTSGFLDGTVWFWWDKLEYMTRRTKRTKLKARVGTIEREYTLGSEEARQRATFEINELCQNAAEADRLACIDELSSEMDVEVPKEPPPGCRPISWDELRNLEKMGMSFGPHTVTHPVLSTTSDEHVEFEMAESWRRLSAEARKPVPIFCYPNGRRRDYGEREMNAVMRLGLWGAVAGHPGAIRPEEYRQPPGICRVPRFSFTDSFLDTLQCVSGFEALKAIIRGTAQGAAC